eukprot:scaffold170_cov281-Pinguiococcus_pyrenoidosus.AAC.1
MSSSPKRSSPFMSSAGASPAGFRFTFCPLPLPSLRVAAASTSAAKLTDTFGRQSCAFHVPTRFSRKIHGRDVEASSPSPWARREAPTRSRRLAQKRAQVRQSERSAPWEPRPSARTLGAPPWAC